jgi:hypothetical protein
MSESVKVGKTEWKVRIAALASFVGSLAAGALLDERTFDVINNLPDGVRPVVLAGVVAAGVWYSARAARSRPDMISKSTLDAVIEHVDLRGGHIERP